MNFLEIIISTPLSYVLQGCYLLVNNFAFALFLFTVVIRFLLFPFNIKQQNSLAKNAAMQAKVEAIKKKYAGDRQKMQEETSKLYAEEKMSPFSGCLPMLLQLPILYGVYYIVQKPMTYVLRLPGELINQATTTFNELVSAGTLTGSANFAELGVINHADVMIEKIPELANYGLQDFNMNLFGFINLGEQPNLGVFNALWLIPLASVVFQFLQMYVMNWFNKRNGLPVTKNFLLTFLLPLIFFFFTFSVPGGVGFYWACGGLVAIMQTCITSTVYSPGQINARNQFALAKKRIAEEKKIKEERANS